MSTELDRARADLERTTLPTAAGIRRRGDRRQQRRMALAGSFAVVVLVGGVGALPGAGQDAPRHPGSARAST